VCHRPAQGWCGCRRRAEKACRKWSGSRHPS
jgi:hypothetical protein